MVGGKSYKIYQAGPQTSTSDILNIRDNVQSPSPKISDMSNTINKTEISKIVGGSEIATKIDLMKKTNFVDKPTENVLKQSFPQSIDRRNSVSDNRIGNADILQQRIVSSSESLLIDKETHNVSFNAAKALQKEEPKKFVPLSTMLKKKEDEKSPRFSVPRTPEDSQNVLLKQLLQNTACATTSASQSASPLPIVPSLEAQLARPVPPTPSSLIPPVLNEPPKPQKEINVQMKPQVSIFNVR